MHRKVLVVARDWGRKYGVTANDRVSFWVDRNVQKLDGGEGCTSLYILTKSQIIHVKMSESYNL